jgi:Arc/MetJ-type ribon-helix-helix transcriptional regulator
LDQLVERGRFPDRTAAVRSAIAKLLRDEREREIVEAHRRGYAAYPPDDEDLAWAEASAKLMAERIAAEEAEDPRATG